VIDQTVAFHADHDAGSAFEYFEGNRSRVLLEQLANARGQAAEQRPVLAALQSRLTKNDAVISYAVLPRELLVWIITRNRFVQHRVPVSASELEDLVNRFHQSLFSESGQPDAVVSERLYRILVDSANRLQPGANFILIPDRWLHFVPFVALRDPSTGHFLVRDHAVSYAPSATLLLSNLAHPPQRFSRSARVLAIGNPAFDQSAFPLPPLPASEVEARRIASLYVDQSPLTGRDATDTALERMAPSFDIIHFAGHAIVVSNVPQLSHLVLASDGRSDGAVFSTDIAQWKLARTRLVILSGCSTADGTLSATEGASSLARAFFAAGVRSVVSSLWAIDDEDTADFFIAFHRRLADGDSPSVALRETQIKWLGDERAPSRPVRSWAAFQLFGG
jgi:CHAT domain-containing protein